MEKASRMEDVLTRHAEAAWREALDQLAAEERRHADAIVSMPFVPLDFAAMLARALDEPEAWPGEHALLVDHHTRTLQTMRASVLATSDEPQRTLCHTPLDLAAMPRLTRALERFFALAREADVDPIRAFGAETAEALVALRPTLAALFAGSYFGGYGPPLYLQPPDLAALARELTTDPALAVIDRRLTSPLVHELSHFGRDRRSLGPPYLDECVAAFLGELAWPAIAVPEPGADDALYLAGWFTQVGAHLDRLVGRRALLRAHAGVEPWESVLPDGLADLFVALGWRQWQRGRHLSFLGETHRPDPWIKAMWLAAAQRMGAADLSNMTLEDLDAIPWSSIPRGAWTAADDALVLRAVATLETEPLQTPEGAWRVRRAPCATRFDPLTGRLERDGVTWALEQPRPLHVVVPPGYRPG